MVAFSSLRDQGSHEGHAQQRECSYNLPELLTLSYRLLADERQRLVNIAIIVRNDPELYPQQCREAIRHLTRLRAKVQQVETFLDTLDPDETERIKPYGCICKLAVLGYHLTECILTLAMFAPISQSICKERIEWHFKLRRLFPILLNAYEDSLSQLDGLSVFERLLRQQDRKNGRAAS